MHAGSLPRPDDVREMVAAKANGDPYDKAMLAQRLPEAVAEVVQKQLAVNLDSINDGEFSKTNFTNYAKERLGGIDIRTFAPGNGPIPLQISGRDRVEFPGYFDLGFGSGRPRDKQAFCVAPLTYAGGATVATDIANFKAALQGADAVEPFLPAVAPGSVEHWLWNEHYRTQEGFVYAIADVMHEEYQAITDSGLLLQIDDPDMFDSWQLYPGQTFAEYRKYAEMRVEALNHALRGIPKDRVRLHVCWGSYHGPHKFEIPLTEVVDLFLSVNAGAFSIEASNPAHDHEWVVWKDVKLPDDAILIPGVVGHASDFIEHPQLVAQRLICYAEIVGRENLMAGTDCGIGHALATNPSPGANSKPSPKAPASPATTSGGSAPAHFKAKNTEGCQSQPSVFGLTRASLSL
jgi:5-methyltetrahydropteroyltriglutamate--homocysteine methyltransferase